MQPVAYLHRAVIISPASMSALSAAIGQALGPSARDDLSFASVSATRDGITYEVCDTPITAETRAGYAAMLANPAILHGAVAAGWERKGMEPPPLTTEQTGAWLSASTIWLGDAWIITGAHVADILQELGFEYLPPADGNQP